MERDADAAAQRVTAMGTPPEGQRFDLGHVRVHTGPQAAASAEALDAHAYTVGNHVVFGRGQYAPDTSAGRNLLAHELTHVAQQSGPAGPRLQGKWRLDSITQRDNSEIEYTDGNGKVFSIAADLVTGSTVFGKADTWQETGIIHQQVGGKRSLLTG